VLINRVNYGYVELYEIKLDVLKFIYEVVE